MSIEWEIVKPEDLKTKRKVVNLTKKDQIALESVKNYMAKENFIEMNDMDTIRYCIATRWAEIEKIENEKNGA